MVDVALIKCKDYASVKESVKKTLGLIGGLDKFIKKGDKVLLKPNMSDPLPPEKAAVTHPLFIKAVIELVKEITPNIWVGDQAASTMAGITAKAFDVSGINNIVKESSIVFRNLQEEEFIEKTIPNRKILEKASFSKAVFDADVIINLPKLKSHGLTYMTGAVKNPFGCVMGNERQGLHKKFPGVKDFSEGIVDIFSVINPQLTIMDAVIAMEGDEGPSYGNPVSIGYVLASEDAVALDVVAAKMTGHNPLAIPTTKSAFQRGLGEGDIKKISMLGDELQKQNFRQHSNYKIRNTNKKGLQPAIIQEKCKKCSACFNNCPANAISDSNNEFTINENECIKCYCCVENCIYGAIELKNPEEKKVANLRLGLDCNENCLFCTVGNDTEPTLTTEEAKEKIKYLAGKKIDMLTLTGGEPTLRKDLPELIRFAKEYGIKDVELQTNAVKFSDKDYLEELKNTGMDFVLIAFHSHKKEVYNKLTESVFYEKALQGIKNCAEMNIRTMISHVINKENYRDLIEFIKFIQSISKKMHIYFSFVRPNGNALNNKWVVPKLAEMEIYLYKMMEYYKALNPNFLVEGIPLCYMQGFERHSAETERMSKPPQEYLAGKESHHTDVHNFIHSNLKKKSEVCRACFLNSICAGVWKEYADLHGTKELYPIFSKIAK